MSGKLLMEKEGVVSPKMNTNQIINTNTKLDYITIDEGIKIREQVLDYRTEYIGTWLIVISIIVAIIGGFIILFIYQTRSKIQKELNEIKVYKKEIEKLKEKLYEEKLLIDDKLDKINEKIDTKIQRYELGIDKVYDDKLNQFIPECKSIIDKKFRESKIDSLLDDGIDLLGIDNEIAVKKFSEVIKMDGKRDECFYIRGLAYKLMKNYEEALSDLEKCKVIKLEKKESIVGIDKKITEINELIKNEKIASK